MAKKVGLAMRLPEGADVSDFDVSGGVAGLASGVTSKLARKASPKALELLQELLGVPLVNPRNPSQMMRVSSVDPQQGIVRLHTSAGERILSSISDFVTAITSGALEEAGPISRKAAGSFDTAGEAGARIPKVTAIGPRGGTTTHVTKRSIPPKATR